MSVCMSPAQARTKWLSHVVAIVAAGKETSSRDFANRALIEILYNDLAKRLHREILSRYTMKRAAISDFLFGELDHRSYFEIPYRDLLWRSLLENLYRRFHTKILYRDIAYTSVNILPRGPLLYRDLEKRPFLGLFYRHLTRTPLLKTLFRDIAQRSATKILPTCLLHT